MMDAVSQELLDLLNIEQLEVDLFRGVGSGGETETRIFGGHVIAQSLMAAYRTVEGRLCHSIHAYFIRPGDPSIPVIYQVERARDGRSFTTRRVVAIQHGKQIFNLSASFQVAEDGWDYQHEMPDVKGPEHWPDRLELWEQYKHRIPEKHVEVFTRERPIEIRVVEPRDLFTPEPKRDVNHVWFRMAAGEGQAAELQHCLLAYASDMNLLSSSLRPHGLTWFQGRAMSASLDHAMWFHRPMDVSAWHLYALDAPFTGGARGFNRGLIYDAEGRLVASTAQEGLMRPVEKQPDATT